VSKERKLKASVNKLHVDGNDVIGWIRQHYGGVTSYVHVMQPANHVNILLGSGRLGGDKLVRGGSVVTDA
jgi:hypothetical protein